MEIVLPLFLIALVLLLIRWAIWDSKTEYYHNRMDEEFTKFVNNKPNEYDKYKKLYFKEIRKMI